MDLAGRSISLPSDISRRKLPDLPDDPCHSSKMSRIWASLKQKLSLRPGRLARSQSRHDDSSSREKQHCYRNFLPYSIYYHLLDNHDTIMLPGLRQCPPPVEEDPPIASVRRSLPPLPSSSHPDYTEVDVEEKVKLGSPHDYESLEMKADSSKAYQTIDRLDYKSAGNSQSEAETGCRVSSMATSINTLPHQGWYWGPLDREETERKLRPHPSGSFLVRDSKNEHHLYTLSFKQDELILHTRIEFVNGLFTFFLDEAKAMKTGKPSVEELIEASIKDGVDGEFGDMRRGGRHSQHLTIRIKLEHPVSRFSEVRSLQFLCKFVLRTHINRENVPRLPLPVHVRNWVQQQGIYTS